MILAHGTLYPDNELPRFLDTLAAECAETIAAQSIDAECVIAACDTLAQRVRRGNYDTVLKPFLQEAGVSEGRFAEALALFQRESLEYKLAVELGQDAFPEPLRGKVPADFGAPAESPKESSDPLDNKAHTSAGSLVAGQDAFPEQLRGNALVGAGVVPAGQDACPEPLRESGPAGTGALPEEPDARPALLPRRRYPLGVLLHIAAGNVDGLPAYSVVEGLLAGNINLLKLPSADRGASVLLLHELVKIEPRLRDFVYVFDVPSSDPASLAALAEAADGVVVWGGDEAVRAARTMAQPNTKIIAWGHKLSFAYAAPDAPEAQLRALARHVCETRQLLCSSCQGIFCDTEDMDAVNTLAERFFALLREENVHAAPAPAGLRGRAALQMLYERLEADAAGRRVLRGDGVGVVIAPDSRPELSPLAGNCWVKPLPRARIVAGLKPLKGHLQTVGLLCADADRQELGRLLARAGAVRITPAGEMSRVLPGEAHDGTYALREYTRVVEFF